MADAIEPIRPPQMFIEHIRALEIVFDEGDLDRLGRYLALLLEANRQFNLTAVKDPDEAWMKHIHDSLTLLPFIVTAEARTMIDIGSGGGLPGLVLAIVLPRMQVTLLEATGKKARFLQQTADALELANVSVINDRAETIGRDRAHHREAYDLAAARAVGRLPVLVELAVPLVRIGGHVLAIKGERAAEEIAEAREALYRLHSHVLDTHRTETGTIVIIGKQRRTPKLYPRRAGEPARAPLGGTRATTGNPNAEDTDADHHPAHGGT
ncbi:MAG: 16S rRNA (guanine(527)-N(7))-methyltransferase RsmG [Planctomycetota bacterium]|nr:16S rRNA (guanine(527)-N(7))-methyltransferase RsmG [Planctomycetota bacterium]